MENYEHIPSVLLTRSLTELKIQSRDGVFDTAAEDYSCVDYSGSMNVVFRGHKKKLMGLIGSHSSEGKFIFGAVAWLTEFDVLDALASAVTAGAFVQFVVQKEDFLRPELSMKASKWKSLLHSKYDKLGCRPFDDLCVYHLYETPYSIARGGGRPNIDAIRCVGNHNSDNSPAFPRMHDKFVVFGSYSITDDSGSVSFLAETVWMGSYNFSMSATQSFESVIILRNAELANTAFLKEFRLLLSLSEPLNWQSEWVCPQFRIGT